MSKLLRMSNEVSKGLKKFISTTELIYGSKKKTYISLSRTNIGEKNWEWRAHLSVTVHWLIRTFNSLLGKASFVQSPKSPFSANNFFVCTNSARSVQCHIFNETESKVQNGSHCWQLFLQGVWWSMYGYAWEHLKQGMGTAGPNKFIWNLTSVGCRANQQRSWGRERNSLHGRPRVFQYHVQIGVSGDGYLTQKSPPFVIHWEVQIRVSSLQEKEEKQQQQGQRQQQGEGSTGLAQSSWEHCLLYLLSACVPETYFQVSRWWAGAVRPGAFCRGTYESHELFLGDW